MGKRKAKEAVEPIRFTPGTAVGWFEGLTMRTGRVKINLPGVRGGPAHAVVNDSAGTRLSIQSSKLFVMADQAPK